MPTVVEQQDRTSEMSEVRSEASIMNNNISTLLENMQLTEPMKFMRVPNHLLETKTFSKVGRNDLVHVRPSVLYFEGFEVGEKQVKRLMLLNASSDVLRLHIIPPQTQHFSIKYTKPDRMLPGMALECFVEFSPDEWRYYYDSIRIHCPGEDNLIVPIHSYPVMNTKDFPRNYTFKPIPVGTRTFKTFPLKSMTPIDFEFNFKYFQPHPAFVLQPLSGIVPANGQVDITVQFSPMEFLTATMKVELNISQFNSKGILCTFTGTCQPGLHRERTLRSMQTEVLDPNSVTPLDRARTNKQRSRSTRSGDQKKKLSGQTKTMTSEKGRVHSPLVIDNPHAVAKVLMHEPGKLKASEVRQNLLSIAEIKDVTRQMKEAAFDQAVRQNVHDEQQNQLRWQVKVGDDPLCAQDRYRLLEDRLMAMSHYKIKAGEPVPEDESKHQITVCSYRRTMRNVGELPEENATFDKHLDDLWTVRYTALNRFLQAVRKVIIRIRAEKRIFCLRKLKACIMEHKATKTVKSFFKPDVKKEEDVSLFTIFTADKVKMYRFPIYVSPGFKDDMAPDLLGIVPVTPTQIVIKRDVPFFNLKVPQYHKLQGYQKHNSHDASVRYVPVGSVRSLRAGAEDEIIKLPQEEFSPCSVTKLPPGGDGATKATWSHKIPGTSKSATKFAKPELMVQPLKPPDALFKPMEYPYLHIMNPAPGLQVFQAPLPYSEVDSDYHLSPLPRYTDPRLNRDLATSKRFLNREDTIKGVMTWKKFPSPSLTSLANTPSLTNVWIPRWDDCFGKDLLPVDVPSLLERLEADDAENCVENNGMCLDGDEESAVCLTPEMVNHQFPLIDQSLKLDEQKSSVEVFPQGSKLPLTNTAVGAYGPMTKEQREEELESFITSRYNKLGSKVQAKVEELDAMITDHRLILK